MMRFDDERHQAERVQRLSVISYAKSKTCENSGFSLLVSRAQLGSEQDIKNQPLLLQLALPLGGTVDQRV